MTGCRFVGMAGSWCCAMAAPAPTTPPAWAAACRCLPGSLYCLLPAHRAQSPNHPALQPRHSQPCLRSILLALNPLDKALNKVMARCLPLVPPKLCEVQEFTKITWYCPHHRCASCKRDTQSAGGTLLRCQVCAGLLGCTCTSEAKFARRCRTWYRGGAVMNCFNAHNKNNIVVLPQLCQA